MADATWTVTSDEPRSITTPQGIVSGRRVTYLTGNGVTGHIDVGPNDYTPLKVKQLIAAAVAVHDEIGQSTTPPKTS